MDANNLWESILTLDPCYDLVVLPPANEGAGIALLDNEPNNFNDFEKCPNCYHDDWDIDEQRGDLVCMFCGLCRHGLLVHTVSRNDEQQASAYGETIIQQSVRDAAFGIVEDSTLCAGRSRRGKSIYKRKQHLRTRIKQWCMLESSINADDWEHILCQFINFVIVTTGRAPVIPTKEQLRKNQPVRGVYVPSKEDIRCILRNCDAVINDSADVMENEMELKPHFLQKYFKNWITIRWLVSLHKATSAEVDENFMELLTENFLRAEIAFEMCVKEIFKTKKSFRYNEFIGRIMELYNLDDVATDFPGLKTYRARKKSYLYWWYVCKYLKWPFLCKESKILRSVIKNKQ